MPDGGVVITVRNEDVLLLYLAYGVHGAKLRLGTEDERVRLIQAYPRELLS